MPATLNHPDISQISFPIYGEGGDPLVSRDFGKPSRGTKISTGGIWPRPEIDQWNAAENFTIQTELVGPDAHDTARRLADLFLSPLDESPITFDTGLSKYDSNMSVVPQAEQAEALTLEYPAGQTWVSVDFGLTRVSGVLGANTGIQAQTPQASGSGPIVIQDGSTRVDLSTDITVERTVGRPNSTVQEAELDYPNYIEKRKAASDVFSLTLDFVEDPATKLTDALSIFSARRGRDTATLDFNGQFGMGQFDVILDGSAGWRDVSQAGDGAVQTVPTIDLRVVE